MSRNRRMAPWVLGCLMAAVALSGLVPLAVAATADHLIISEVFWPGTRAPKGSQCIKIVNPTDAAVPMGDVFLTDAHVSPGSLYYNIVYSQPATYKPGGTASQAFHARFPAGFTMAAGDTVVIAVNGSAEYMAEYGVKPDFELVEDALAPDDIPELVEAFPGSINVDLALVGSTPVLDRVSGSLILYTWDQDPDTHLVADLDYVTWGTNTNFRVNKAGVTILGSAYLNDTSVGSQTTAAATINAGSALRRVSGDEGAGETDGAAGNGLTGHDETGEALATTFQVVSGLLVAAGPAVAVPSAPVFDTVETTPAVPHAGSATTVSVTLDSYSSLTGVTFYYSVDDVDQGSLTGVDGGSGTWTAQIPQQAVDAVVAWYCEAVNADGATAMYPASAPLYFTAFTVETAPVVGEGADKLLITEVNVGPDIYPYTGLENIASEFIEIHNPNAYDVDLSDYYLSDAISYVSGAQLYWNIALGATATNVGGGNYNDFTARFPDGFTIQADSTIVIAIAGSDLFQTTYGQLPDLELYEDGASADAIPDMRNVYATGNSIYNPDLPAGSDGMPEGIPDLEDHYGEPVILFHWTEGADLVTDIDIFIFGEAKTGTYRYSFDKSGVTVGASAYADDTAPAAQDWFVALTGGSTSYQRSDLTEGTQTSTGGNGVDGRDETSENMSTTFTTGAPTPGALEGGGGNTGGGTGDGAMKLLITEVSSGQNIFPTYTGPEMIAMEFIEIHNPNDEAVDLSDYYLTDATNYAFGANQVYYRIALGPPHTYDQVGGGNYNDFHARFPDGFTIAAHGTIVVSIGGSDGFYSIFNELPDLELYEDGATADEVPDMRPLFGAIDGANSIHDAGNTSAGSDGLPRGVPELEEHYGEVVILYHWVEGADLVTDIDFFAFGTEKTGDFGIAHDKTNITIGASTYLPDTAPAAQSWFLDLVEDGSVSYRRVVNDEGDQTATGGNGVGGRDETSEDFTVTFSAEPFSPGFYELAGTGGGGEVTDAPTLELAVEAATFIPREGQEYSFRFKISVTDFEFRLRIFDTEGRLVRTLYDNRFDDPILPGFFKNVAWDGRNDTYELVRAGMYIAHFSIVDIETGTEETTVMPVVVASRLDK